MASENCFDIISKIDLQEVDNAIQQSIKEIHQRYDLKGSGADIRRDRHSLYLQAENEYKLKAVTEVLTRRLAGRRVPLKGLVFQTPEAAIGGSLRQEVVVQQGIPADKAKEIVKILKTSGLKVQAAILGDQVRVRGKSKDDLQGAIHVLRDSPLSIDMQFTNYR